MLCSLARASIDELRSMGINDLTPDEIVTLSDLAKAVESSACSLAGGVARAFPVVVSGVQFSPPTCAGEDWISRHSETAKVNGLSFQFYAYALAHGRNPGALQQTSSTSAVNAVKKWWNGLPCSPAEVDAAIDALAGFIDTTARGEAVQGLELLRAYLRGSEEAEAALDVLAGMLAEKKKNHEEAQAEMGGQFWRDVCLRLNALGCGDVETWYYRSREEAVKLFGYAIDMATLKAGGDVSKQAVPVDKIRALRFEMARIEQTRKPKT